MSNVISIIQLSFVSIVVLLIVALGGLMSEKSGVVNIGLEGLMLMGGFVGIWIIKILQESTGMNHQFILLIGILVGGIVGGIFASAHAFASIKMNADQTISGTALNLFAPAFAIFTARSVLGGQQVFFDSSKFLIRKVPLLGDIPFIGDIFFQRTYLSFYLAIVILVLIWILLYKTKLGLRIRAVGENPQAADAQGVNIYRVRYFSVITSGVLAGFGGVIFVATTSQSFDATVAGMGFLAIAVLIFGNWRPWRILMAAVFFGFFRTIASAHTLIPFLAKINIPSEFYHMLPFLATLIILALTSKLSRAPKALGDIYDIGQR